MCILNRRIVECYDKLLLTFIICQQSKKFITSYEEKWNIFDVIIGVGSFTMLFKIDYLSLLVRIWKSL